MNTKKISTPIAAILLAICVALPLLNTKITPHVTHLISYAALAFVSIVLFMKKRDNLLIIALLCNAFTSIIKLISFGFGISTLLSLVASLLLVLIALVNCDQTLIKYDFTKLQKSVNTVFFVPAILNIYGVITTYQILLQCSVYNTLFNRANLYDPYWVYKFCLFLTSVLYTIALLQLGAWLKNPYQKANAASAAEGSNYIEDSEAYCSLGKHILLCLFTCGIWYLIWTYRTTKFLNKAPGAVQYSPVKKLLLCMFIPFYQIYWFYKHGQRIDAMAKQKKVAGSDMATLCLILGIFIPIVACILMQDKINNICMLKEVVAEDKHETETTEELKKYKELLDQGVITQEEFDAKKKQLLSL